MFKQYDAYQDSNNLELPIVPVGWKVDRIKYEIKLLTGYPFNSSKYTEEGIKLVRGINVKESILDWKDTAYWPEVTPDLQRYLLKDGDLLIGMDGSKVGKNFCQVSEQDLPLLLLQRVARLRVKNLLNARYLYWNLASKRFLNWINRSKTDPMIPHMAPKDINDFVIAYPSTEEQSRIALFLDQKTTEIDQAIAIKEQQMALLNERKQIVIQKAVTQGLDSNVPMKDSGVEWIGKIPEHWEIKKIKHVAGDFMYGTSVECNTLSSGTPVLRIPNIDELDVNFDDLKYTQLSKSETENYSLKQNDILVIRTNGNPELVGKSALIRNLDRELLFASYLIRIKPKKLINPEFLICIMNSSLVRKALTNGARTSVGNYNLNTQTLGNCFLTLPPLDEQLPILNFIRNQSQKLDDLININENQIEKLKEYKTTIINDAVTGKIKVA